MVYEYESKRKRFGKTICSRKEKGDSANPMKEIANLIMGETLCSSEERCEIHAIIYQDGKAYAATWNLRYIGNEPCITEEINWIPEDVLLIGAENKMLTSIDPSNNKYGFFKIVPITGQNAKTVWTSVTKAARLRMEAMGRKAGDSCIYVSFGRMGVENGSIWDERTYILPVSYFWLEYEKLLKEGYKDRSEVYFSKPITKNGEKEQESMQELYEKLSSYARHAVSKAKIKAEVTEGIINESRRLIRKLRKCSNVKDFNNILLELVSVLQRPTDTAGGKGVQKLLASDSSDFAGIIQREEDLLASMEGLQVEGFFSSGVKVYPATDKQKSEVLAKLDKELANKVKQVYRVIPEGQKASFNKYLEAHNKPKVKMFWHGSRNENWLSIIQNSLSLNPNAVITGKMFGDGIYFAPSSKKSYNYTSISGSYWAKGSSDTAFMGLYATAYGIPKDVHTWSRTADYESMVKNCGCNCLHAHAGASLKNDEIVFYDENAILLNYLVEFQN